VAKRFPVTPRRDDADGLAVLALHHDFHDVEEGRRHEGGNALRSSHPSARRVYRPPPLRNHGAGRSFTLEAPPNRPRQNLPETQRRNRRLPGVYHSPFTPRQTLWS
jgi:hypothetical protein